MKFSEHLDSLAALATDYVKKIDGLVDSYRFDSRYDDTYSDTLKAQRIEQRKADYEREIRNLADSAKEKAKTHLDGLRAIVADFVTADTDTGLLAQLQALKTTGVQLSGPELAIYQKKCAGNYIGMKLLSEISGIDSGMPKLDDFENDVNNLASIFNSLFDYRGPQGELAGLSATPPVTTWGTDTRTGSVIEQRRLTSLPQTAKDMTAAWEQRMSGDFIPNNVLAAKQMGKARAGGEDA